MYYVYVIRSSKDNKYYIGYTVDLTRRLQDHNRGKSKSVRYRGPFELVYYEKFPTRLEAIRREKQIKSYKGGDAFKTLLSESMTPSSSLVQDTCLSRTRHEFKSRRGRQLERLTRKKFGAAVSKISGLHIWSPLLFCGQPH